MENLDKGCTVSKLGLIVRPKIPKRPQNLSAQFVCPSPKVWDFNEKRLHWASEVCGMYYVPTCLMYLASTYVPHRIHMTHKQIMNEITFVVNNFSCKHVLGQRPVLFSQCFRFVF